MFVAIQIRTVISGLLKYKMCLKCNGTNTSECENEKESNEQENVEEKLLFNIYGLCWLFFHFSVIQTWKIVSYTSTYNILTLLRSLLILFCVCVFAVELANVIPIERREKMPIFLNNIFYPIDECTDCTKLNHVSLLASPLIFYV